VGCIAICDLIKTTLGPKGMDKILQSQSNRHEVQVTNDGATILKAIHLDNPAAKVLVNISKTQVSEACVLAQSPRLTVRSCRTARWETGRRACACWRES
jgi:hypothetical protein